MKKKEITRKTFALIFCILLIKASVADIRIEINKKRKERKERGKKRAERNLAEAQDVITRGDWFDIQIRPVYTSRARARAKRNEKGGKIYARACMYAPGVIKGVNDGRGKSHNPLLFADLSVFRDALSGALSSAGAM